MPRATAPSGRPLAGSSIGSSGGSSGTRPGTGRRLGLVDVTPYDALLLVSFGGPEKPDDVVPFLENVTRGRGIPRESLGEVGSHHVQFGGRSPINEQHRAFLAALRADLAEHGLDIPVYWGNRNWDPLLDDTLA